MISQKHKKQLAVVDFISNVFRETAESIISEQLGIAETYYNRQTGDLINNLSSKTFNITKSATGANLVIRYLKYIRFLDMRKTVSGKKKKVYHPIYNKVIYGYLYNYTYAMLRFGISEKINENVSTALADASETPLTITV